MAVMMTTQGRFAAPFAPVIGRVCERPDPATPGDSILLCRAGQVFDVDPSAFAAVLMEKGPVDGPRSGLYASLSHLAAGDIVLVDGGSGRTRTLIRRASSHNALFLTESCNNACLMCSQPPRKDHGLFDQCHRVLDLLRDDPPAALCLSGGEPTLFGNAFVGLIRRLATEFPHTTLTALSNGRRFTDPALADAVAAAEHPRLRFSIPLHADVPDRHDYIAQARGAFHETLAGFYTLQAAGIETEVRVVLHALSHPRLLPLAEFVWRKLPFVTQVVLMGLEPMGYARKNRDLLWIDPLDYAESLRRAAEHLYRRGMEVSIYNLPLCILPRAIWGMARQSISDYKQTLLPDCTACAVHDHCPGFFTSGTDRPSRGISPIPSVSV